MGKQHYYFQWIEIDLDALTHNIKALRSRLEPRWGAPIFKGAGQVDDI